MQCEIEVHRALKIEILQFAIEETLEVLLKTERAPCHNRGSILLFEVLKRATLDPLKAMKTMGMWRVEVPKRFLL